MTERRPLMAIYDAFLAGSSTAECAELFQRDATDIEECVRFAMQLQDRWIRWYLHDPEDEDA